MYCPLTGKPCHKPKNVHVTEMQEGEPSHVFLCGECASQLEQLTGGVAFEPPMMPEGPSPIIGTPFGGKAASKVPAQKPPAHSPLGFFMNLLEDLERHQEETKVMRLPCPECGHTLHDLARGGKIGCPNCYKFFHMQLSPLISQVQSGGIHHIGKKPRHPKHEQRSALQNSLDALQKKMDAASKDERYEDAALIRDQMLIVRKKIEFGESED